MAESCNGTVFNQKEKWNFNKYHPHGWLLTMLCQVKEARLQRRGKSTETKSRPAAPRVWSKREWEVTDYANRVSFRMM